MLTSEHICCRNTAINLVPGLLSLFPFPRDGHQAHKGRTYELPMQEVYVPQITKPETRSPTLPHYYSKILHTYTGCG
jgi:hypothetical protein